MSELASQPLLIPVDLRSSSSPPPVASTSKSTLEALSKKQGIPRAAHRSDSTTEVTSASTRRGPSRPPRRSSPLLQPSDPTPESRTPPRVAGPRPPLDRRKLIRAFQARTAQSRADSHKSNRFMQGPEPSWMARKTRTSTVDSGEQVGEHRCTGHGGHGPACNHG